jgi:large subunit ribosomal protein L31
MKKNTHPEYQQVLFVDQSTGHKFVCGAALKCDEKEVFEGVEYPVYRVSISSASHPFFTGSKQVLDTEGRVDRFKKRYEAAANRTKQKEGEKEKEKEKAPAAKKAVRKKK